MTEQPVLVDRAGRVGRVTLNRPERLNALTPALIAALEAAVGELCDDREIHAIVLRGAGRAFLPGYDLDWGTEARRRPKQPPAGIPSPTTSA